MSKTLKVLRAVDPTKTTTLRNSFVSDFNKRFKSLGKKVIEVVDYRYFSWGALVLICGIVWVLTGPLGFFTMLVASAIGWIPVLFNSRRSKSSQNKILHTQRKLEKSKALIL